MARPKRKPLEPVPLSPDEQAHVADLHARLGGALSIAQVSALFAMSLGRADANGRAPSAREQLGASVTLLNALVARPKPKADDVEEGGAVFQMVDPYAEVRCERCGNSFVPSSGPSTPAIGAENPNAPANAAGEEQ